MGSKVSKAYGYERAVATLNSAARFGINPSLDNITLLCERLDRPQDAFRSIQVTGTNGKSSVTRMTSAILRAHGLSVGCYTSPELERYPERVEVDGAPVSDDRFARSVNGVASVAKDLGKTVGTDGGITEFELLTAAALDLFRDSSVDVAVMEVGMGGRWDATSVVQPAVSVITGIALDHMDHLGDTREAISSDKARIISESGVAILGPGTIGVEGPMLDRAEELAVPVTVVRKEGDPTPVSEESTARFSVLQPARSIGESTLVEVRGTCADYGTLRLKGPSYQAPNIATSVVVAERALDRALDTEALRSALSAMRLPGRFESLADDPPVVIDAAHNPEAARVLAAAIMEMWGDDPPMALLGVLSDKDAAGIVRELAPAVSGFAVTRSSSPRALDPQELSAIVESETGEEPLMFGDISEAIGFLGEHAPSGLIATGSITVAGEVRRTLTGGKR